MWFAAVFVRALQRVQGAALPSATDGFSLGGLLKVRGLLSSKIDQTRGGLTWVGIGDSGHVQLMFMGRANVGHATSCERDSWRVSLA